MAPGEGFEPSRPMKGHRLTHTRLKACATRPPLLEELVHSAYGMKDASPSIIPAAVPGVSQQLIRLSAS